MMSSFKRERQWAVLQGSAQLGLHVTCEFGFLTEMCFPLAQRCSCRASCTCLTPEGHPMSQVKRDKTFLVTQFCLQFSVFHSHFLPFFLQPLFGVHFFSVV